MSWHPIETVRQTEFVFPKPGTDQPFAVIRWVEVSREGETVWVWRAVTFEEPRTLIAYNPDLRDLCQRVHRSAIGAGIRPELDETRR